MGPALREAWLWLLLAFVLGVVIGYFLRRYTVEDDAPDAAAGSGEVAAPNNDGEPGAPAEHGADEAEDGSEATAGDVAAPDEADQASGVEEPPAEPAPVEDEPRPRDAGSIALGGPDLTKEERELVEKDAAAFTALAELSAGRLSDSHGVTKVTAEGEVVEESQETPPRGEAPPEQRVDTHQTFMPVVEPLRVPGGRSQMKAQQPAESAAADETTAVAADGQASAAPAAEDAPAPEPTRKRRRQDS